MKYIYFDIDYKVNNCILRSLSKALNRSANNIYLELKEINLDNDQEFDDYLLSKGFIIDKSLSGKVLNEINLDGTNIIYAYKDKWFHLMCSIDKTIYDKHSYDEIKDLKIIKIYKKL